MQLRFREIPSCAIDGRQLASGGCVSKIRGPGPDAAPEGGCCGKGREEWEEEWNEDNVAHDLLGEKEEVGLLFFSLLEWYLKNHWKRILEDGSWPSYIVWASCFQYVLASCGVENINLEARCLSGRAC